MTRSAAQSVEESYPVFDGVATRVLEIHGSGPTIILLHGFSDSADSFRSLMHEIARHERHAVAVDLPGHGRAGAVRSPVLAAMDSFMDAVIGRYGQEPPILAGNSLGGLVALRAASRDSLPIAAVAGLGPAGVKHTLRLRLAEQLFARWDTPLRRVIGAVPVPRLLVRSGLTAFALVEGKADWTSARRYASHFDGMGDVTRMLGHFGAGHREGVMDTPFEQVRVPVLLIWGARDGLTDPKGAGRILDVVPQSRLVMLPRVGHVPHVQRPAQIAELLVNLPDSVLEPSDPVPGCRLRQATPRTMIGRRMAAAGRLGNSRRAS